MIGVHAKDNLFLGILTVVILDLSTVTGQVYTCTNAALAGPIVGFVDGACDFPGNDVGNIPTPANPQVCATACEAMSSPACIAFNFAAGAPVCYLKSVGTTASVGYINQGWSIYLRKACTIPAQPANGASTYNGYPDADGNPCSFGLCNLTTTCNCGYALSGSAISPCILSGSSLVFSPPPSSCNPIYCGPVVAPTNGFVTGGTAAHNPCGTVANYHCNQCFAVQGSSTSQCVQPVASVAPMAWSVAAPTCVAANSCGPLVAPANGSIVGGTAAQNPCGAMATYSCKPCFTLQGASSVRTCVQPTADMPPTEWLPTAPTCVGEPSLCANIFDTSGTIASGPYMYATSYTFTCITGYTLAPSAPGMTNQTYTCNCNGSWNSPFIACQLSCMPLAVANGAGTHYTLPSLKPGTKAYWSCSPGYIASGDSVVTCSSMPPTWTWVTAPPTCTSAAALLEGFSASLPNYTSAQVANALSLNAIADATTLSTTVLDALSYVVGGLNSTQLPLLSYSIQDMLLDCQFSGVNCRSSDFILGVQDSTFGSCFTFNYLNMTQPYVELRPGEEQGLFIALNVKQEEYISVVSTAGMRIIVLDQRDLILPDVMGWNVQPGTATSFIIRLTTTSRFKSPVSNCIGSGSQLANSVPYYYPASYSTEACMRSAVQSSLIQTCGCASLNYAVPPGNGVQACNLSQIMCANNFIAINASQIVGKSAANCPEPCIVNEYDASRVFAVTVPLSSGGFCMANPPNSNLTCQEFSRSDLILLRVYFQSLFHMSYTEYPALTINGLLANIGGLTLMYAGMSVISVVEVLLIPSEEMLHWSKRKLARNEKP